MPIEPVDPSKKTGGQGSEKYTPNEKRGPSEFDKTMERVKAEEARAKAHQMAEEHRAKVEAERPRTYTERLQDMGRLPKGGGGTMVECVPQYMAEHGIKPECAVILTDGYLGGSWGTWSVPVVWCIQGNKSTTAGNGVTVHID